MLVEIPPGFNLRVAVTTMVPHPHQPGQTCTLLEYLAMPITDVFPQKALQDVWTRNPGTKRVLQLSTHRTFNHLEGATAARQRTIRETLGKAGITSPIMPERRVCQLAAHLQPGPNLLNRILRAYDAILPLEETDAPLLEAERAGIRGVPSIGEMERPVSALGAPQALSRSYEVFRTLSR